MFWSEDRLHSRSCAELEGIAFAVTIIESKGKGMRKSDRSHLPNLKQRYIIKVNTQVCELESVQPVGQQNFQRWGVCMYMLLRRLVRVGFGAVHRTLPMCRSPDGAEFAELRGPSIKHPLNCNSKYKYFSIVI